MTNGVLVVTLGKLIKDYCSAHDMTYQQFAEASHVTKGYVSMLVNNKNPRTGKPIVPTIKTYNDLAAAMGMTIDQLFEVIDDSPVSLNPPVADDDEIIPEDELMQIREDMRRNPELRTLHSMARNVTRGEIKQIEAFIRAIRTSNDYDETDTP